MNNGGFASLEELTGAKISVFGLGVSGLSACRLLNACGAQLSVINQNLDSSLECYEFLLQSDPRAAQVLAESDLIILSPGIARTHEALSLARQKNTKIWNEIELGFRLFKNLCPQAKCLAITGTNGKTTTVSMVGEILKNDGHGVFVGGNIGTPLCDLVSSIKLGDLAPEDYPASVVLELSSFQLESLESFRPHVAAILNISASHGERYQTVGEYANAKGNITKMLGAGDLLLTQKDDTWSEKVVKAGPWLWQRLDQKNLNLSAYDLSNFSPFGAHNLLNLDFAIRMVKHVGASDQAIQKMINEFNSVPHRLENILDNGIALVLNDSKSTNWASTLVALKSVREDKRWKDETISLVVGGKCRGHHDFPSSETIDLLVRARVKLIAFGEFAHQYAEQIRDKFEGSLVVNNFEEILKGWDEKGVLLFSPAFPSFDEFKSYADRGDTFKKLIQTR